MRRISVVKPDHIGDLVLASPAIGWLASQSSETRLFVRSSNISLARHLFPSVSIAPLDLAHLAKNESITNQSLQETISATKGSDVTVFLRSDHILQRERLHHIIGPCIFTDNHGSRHESTNNRMGIRVYFGDYDPDITWLGNKRSFPNAIKAVGLCIGSGFPSNKWSVIRWSELGKALLQRGCLLRLIGGPAEGRELRLLADVLELPPQSITQGGADIGGFLRSVGELDVVIATDGGAGHLSSLACPVLTIAASVPFRRFAPFGAMNRVVSMDLPCSPCLNADEAHVNLCFSHECSYGIVVEDVLAALDCESLPPGNSRRLNYGATVFFGVSHAG